MRLSAGPGRTILAAVALSLFAAALADGPAKAMRDSAHVTAVYDGGSEAAVIEDGPTKAARDSAVVMAVYDGGSEAAVIEDGPTKAARDSAVVMAVLDGDTVKVRFDDGAERKVRLIGIDSPELADSRDSVRFMALMARRFAYLRLKGRRVGLAYEWPLEDKYGRLLAYLTPDGGAFFNEEILKEGFARVLRAFPHDPEMMKRFERAEAAAKQAGNGLWAKDGPPGVSAAEIGRHRGRLVTVPLEVARTETRRGFVVLHPRAGDFEVLIPKSGLESFGGTGDIAGRSIRVSGLVESYRGRIQVMVYMPFQIKAFS